MGVGSILSLTWTCHSGMQLFAPGFVLDVHACRVLHVVENRPKAAKLHSQLIVGNRLNNNVQWCTVCSEVTKGGFHALPSTIFTLCSRYCSDHKRTRTELFHTKFQRIPVTLIMPSCIPTMKTECVFPEFYIHYNKIEVLINCPAI